MSRQIQENLETFGFVGLGSMGGSMAKNLSKSVDKLRVFDLAGTKERAPENALCCYSLEEIAASCNTLFLSLPDGGDVIQTVLELSNLKQTSCKTVIDTSTIGIDAVNQVQQVLDNSGITYLDCCLLYTSPSPRDRQKSRMPSSA